MLRDVSEKMGRRTGNVLLIATDSPGESLSRAKQRYAGDSLSVLCFDRTAQDEPLPEAWQRLRVDSFLDMDALRRDFLEFLDTWPRRPLRHGKSFDQMFRRPGGYSIWWTGPGMYRHPETSVFRKLKTLWVCDRAIKAYSPARILIATRQADLARSLASRCRRDGIDYELLLDSARGTHNPWGGRLRWLVKSFACLFVQPWYVLVRALFARLLARTRPETKSQRKQPAVVFASALYPRFRIEQGRISLYYWRELSEALHKTRLNARHRFRLRISGSFQGYHKVLRLYHTAWRVAGSFDAAVPIHERYPAWGAQLRSFPGLVISLLRYFRLERTAAFRSSFEFAGADVSGLYVSLLRRTMTRLGAWAQTMGALVQSLGAVGNVSVVLVCEEMYPVGMLDIAAARRLGIPTIGVQHGAISPMHPVYTLPPGQVAGAPTPDYFAVYGEFGKETVSVHGAYPADRVWITAGTRFDHWIKNPPDAAAARQRLGLPGNKRIVLLTTQRFPWFVKAAKAAFQAAKGREDCLVCLKAHPLRDPVDVYRRVAQQVGAENVRFFTERFDELLVACDVLVSGPSTTILEAILLGRKTICANFSGEPDPYPYVADGGSLAARSDQQMCAALDQALSLEAQGKWETERRRFLKRHAGPTADGRAAETFAGMIAAMCSANREKEGARTIDNA